MSLAAKATIRGAKKLQRDVVAARKKFGKAHDTAIRVVAFRRLKDMAKEIRRGAPGGRSYAGLTDIARQDSRLKSGFSRRKPFTRLTGNRGEMNRTAFLRGLPPIRYNAIEGAGGRLKEAEVGLTNRGIFPSGSWWIRVGNVWGQGQSVPISAEKRKRLADEGAEILKRNPRSKLARRFFLKKTTTRVDHPKREIIRPFWVKWRHPSIAELNQVFKAKLAGKRV